MRKFQVNSGRITGLNGNVYVQGCVIEESKLRSGHADILVSRGRLTEVTDYSIKDGEKIKLAIVTSVWGRPDIFEMFIKGVKNLGFECPDFDFTLVISASLQEDATRVYDEQVDYETMINREICGLWDCDNVQFKLIEIPNEPLAAKVNATTYACKNLDVHYVLCMGSDDIISPELLNEYAVHMRKGIDFIGVTDCYFYDTVSKKSLYWGGYLEPYRKGHTCGAFRALSARLLSKWDWMPWENKDSHVLDKSMQDKLKVTPHTIHTFSMKEKGLFGLDIKSGTNMTPFAKWNNSEFIDTEIIKKQFPYIF